MKDDVLCTVFLKAFVIWLLRETKGLLSNIVESLMKDLCSVNLLGSPKNTCGAIFQNEHQKRTEKLLLLLCAFQYSVLAIYVDV